ncbi:hypothetical protein BS78_05G177100 [Paspalum vaginatum]|nr:hypothetical protein BS78_05G177100 [Paspalum vaginatum]
MGDDRRRLHCSGEDRISGLPDELLHGILLRLGSTRAAVRTSVLSRRWRHVWASLPELILVGGPIDGIDGVLAAYSSSAPTTLDRLAISLSACRDDVSRVPAERVAPWLRFAAERVAGELCLVVIPPSVTPPLHVASRPDLELAVCGRAKTITLHLQEKWLLRPTAAGLFTALTGLVIFDARMKGDELAALVWTQCPCLRDLELSVTLVDAFGDVCIRSDSLRSLWFRIRNALKVEIVAPRLEKLSVCYAAAARISAPNLVELVWCSNYDPVPRQHQFDSVSRRLGLLQITDRNCTEASVMQKFDEADELKLHISIPKGALGYGRFLDETNKMPKCKVLNVTLVPNDHGFAPGMLHLLRTSKSTKKILINLYDNPEKSCPLYCPCRLEENCRVDDIDVGSLEEVEISSHSSSCEVLLEFVELLSRCNTTRFKKLAINYHKRFHTTETKQVCKKIRSMHRPNIEIKFYVLLTGGLVHFDYIGGL